MMENKQEKDRIVTSHELLEELKNAPPQQSFQSGHKFLDELIGGFAEGDLVIIGGTQKSGKSTFIQTLTKRFAEQDIACLWFSIEMSNRELLNRFGPKLPIFHLPRVMPTGTTLSYVEKKIKEAKLKHNVKVVFIDHIGMMVDEETARQKNHVEILDARLQRIKAFAISERVCIIAIAPFSLGAVRKKNQQPSTGDFRGTAMLGYTADTLLAMDRMQGQSNITTANEKFSDIEALKGGYLIPSDSYLHILDSRRTGARKVKIKMDLDPDTGDLREI